MGYKSEEEEEGVKGTESEDGWGRGFPYPNFQKVLKISSKTIFISIGHLWNLWHINTLFI